ncbi:MAG TPA: hypothetical protein VFZ64_08185 [Nocardioidaceae bacterium]
MDVDTPALLRLEVGRLRAREAGRRFETTVHVGRLDGPSWFCGVPAADPLVDAGTRAEVVTRLVERGGLDGSPACAWLHRTGEPLLEDEDLAWLAATTHVFDALGCRLDGFWSVTRTGWLDVRTQERRTWKRLRLR